MKLAGIRLLDIPAQADREYTYAVPAPLEPEVRPGRFVSVPFGRNDSTRLALVVSTSEADGAEGLKNIAALCSDRVGFDQAGLGLLGFICSQTLCSFGDAIHAMIPSQALSRLKTYYLPAGDGQTGDPEADRILSEIRKAGRVPDSSLSRRFGKEAKRALDRLVSARLIRRSLEPDDPPVKKTAYYSLAVDREFALSLSENGSAVGPDGKKTRLPSEARRRLLARLAVEGELPAAELTESGLIDQTDISALLSRGLICARYETRDRDEEYLDRRSGSEKSEEITLNDEQQKAYSVIEGFLSDRKPHAVLLEGVTGSGKTCVMLRAIDKALADGRGVILLIPEISLTPQTISIFRSRYGSTVSVMHSGLSAGERADAYTRVREGRARLVIGTRSAVFAPVSNLGMIIIDEEQEHTYKSDSSPRYHARDAARYRCARENALLLLASATPSLESRYKAQTGKYTLLRLSERYGGSVLPEVTVADMRPEYSGGNLSPIGRLLASKLTETFEKGKQSVLFLNRRGYNNFVSCAACGQALQCPNCSVSLNYHISGSSGRNGGALVCHWCGFRCRQPEKCPSCGSPDLLRIGYGTQRVEEDLGKLLPGARILRMDTDSTATKDAYFDMLGRFRRHEADVLLGTQMVTKGHDFPDVTLVGVLLADASLYYDDYRAAERTFAMLTQVIGRAGRRDEPGEAVIQTNNPDHEIIALARAQNYEEMYSREIGLRKQMIFPPFCDIALLTVSSEREEKALGTAAEVFSELKEATAADKSDGRPFILYGPFEAPVYRFNGKYRMRIVAKCLLDGFTRGIFAGIINKYQAGGREVSLSVDFNPTSV